MRPRIQQSIPAVRFLVVVVAVAFVLSGCAENHSPLQANSETEAALISSELVGAKGRVEPHERSVVGIELINSAGEAIDSCTGTLISRDAVLSAAHCFHPRFVGNGGKFRVHFHRNMAESMKQASMRYNMKSTFVHKPIDVAQVFIHPEFDSQGYWIDEEQVKEGVKTTVKKWYWILDHDLAVISLSTAAPLWAEPIAMADASTSLKAGTALTVYGFGRSVDFSNGASHPDAKKRRNLQKGAMVLDAPTGADKPKGDHITTKADSKTSVCNGDSGGPSMIIKKDAPPVIVAVSSAINGKMLTPTFRSCKGASLLTPVAPYRDWIDSVVATIPPAPTGVEP